MSNLIAGNVMVKNPTPNTTFYVLLDVSAEIQVSNLRDKTLLAESLLRSNLI